MRIFTADIATNCGYALYDTERPPSSIISGSVRFDGSNAFEKVADVRRKIPKLIREMRPDFSVIEAPLSFIPQFKKTVKTMFGEEKEETTVNPTTIMQLNRLAGAVHVCIAGYNIPCIEVAPRSWQSIIPANIKGPPKARVKAYCKLLKIVSSNNDSRDACIIAIWAAGRCQELKMVSRTAQALSA